MLKKLTVFFILIIFIISGCSDKKENDDVNIKNLSKFEQILKEVKEYNKKNATKTVSVTVQDGLYVKNGTVLNFYSFGKMEVLTFDEKADLLEKIEAAPTTAIVSVADFAKTFYNYVTLEDLLKNGENASAKIGLTTTVYDLEKSSYTFATGFGIETPVIGTGGGSYTTAQTVIMTCATSGIKIRYTTDGTEPTISSAEYTNGIAISSTTTLKAKAFSIDGLVSSSTATALYTINTLPAVTGFLYAGKTYMGKTSAGTEIAATLDDTGINLTEPKARNFTCDGYFDLKGTYSDTGVDKYFSVYVMKNSTGEDTTYFIEGFDFNTKIWLRFGAGEYTIKIYPIKLEKNFMINEPYDGDILSYSIIPYVLYRYNVTNTRNEDGRFLYPSCFIQSDSPVIYNEAIRILTEKDALNADVKTKAWYIHNYIIDKLKYDRVTLCDALRKRKQDALSCYNTGWAVCEGYTSLYNALLRSLGIEAKAILGNSGHHAWSNVLDETGKWCMVDTTWDDIDVAGIYSSTYFWLPDNTGYNNDHSWTDDRAYRGAEKELSPFMSAKEGMY